MVTKLSTQHNTSEVSKHLRKLPDRYVRRAVHQAINTTLRNTRVEFTRRVRARYAVKAGAVRDKRNMQVNTASRGSLVGGITWRFRALSLKEFGNPRQVRAGVKVTQLKGQRDLIKHAFVSEQMGGHVFKRQGEKRIPVKGRYAGKGIKRQKVTMLFGPSMVSQAQRIMPGMRGFVVDRMVENTRQASNRFIDLARRHAR
jgi:hypothetical protein